MAASSLLPPGYPAPSPYSHLSPYHPLPGMLPPSLLPPSLAPPPPHLTAPPPTSSTTTSSSTSSASPATLGTSPYLCSWMQGRDFCGRRFNSSEELMSHLRSHTANMGEGAPPAAPGPAGAAPPPPQTPALALLQAQAAQMRSHISPPSTSSPTPPSSSPSSLPPQLQLPSSSPSLPPHLHPPILGGSGHGSECEQVPSLRASTFNQPSRV